MKKKLLALFAIAAFFVAVFATPVKKVEADCPNGCLVDCGPGCDCNGWHPNLLEKDHGDQEVDEM
jgi:hypothetical protein